MLVSKRVFIKISSSNKHHWRNLGYSFADPCPQKGIHGAIIEVSTDQLLPKSCVQVECWCENCEKFFVKRFSQYTEICQTCTKLEQNKGHIGNNYGTANKGKVLLHNRGELNAKWNPNKSEFKKYASKVTWLTILTYREHKDTINPNDFPRTLCGVDGGYQLDHKISIKYGFDHNIEPAVLSKVENLQMLPWKDNRSKWHSVDINTSNSI
jgi:hypothetical protein